MAKYCLKKPSKRMACKKKYKIEKKVKAHNKKMKREERAKKLQKRSRGREKPISVPNKCPFKEELLAEAEARRAEIEQEKASKKAEQKVVKAVEPKKKRAKKADTEGPTEVETVEINESHFIVEAADLRGEANEVDMESGLKANKQQSKPAKAFAGEVRKIIESADVIIEVLDARDPLGSRSSHIEKLVLSQGKRLVLLLNKIDLVPKENVLAWLAHLRKELPCIAFKASTQEQSNRLGHFNAKGSIRQLDSAPEGALSSRCMGAELVMRLLGNYCRSRGVGGEAGASVKLSIRVGVVGFPNVGKSSVINSLKRKRICVAGATPGLTRCAQEVQLDSHIRLLDSPGVVLNTGADADRLSPGELALRNALRVESLQDPVTPVEALLRRCSVRVLMLHYNLPAFDSCDTFLSLLARKLGRLKKGGVPDHTAAARHVLNEWNRGKLRYYTEPPKESGGAGEGPGLGGGGAEAALVAQFSAEFDLDSLDRDVKTLVEGLPEEMDADDGTVYDPTRPLQPPTNTTAQSAPTTSTKTMVFPLKKPGGEEKEGRKKDRFAGLQPAQVLAQLANEDGNQQAGRVLKGVMKKQRKVKRKMAEKAGELADVMAGMGALDEEMMGGEDE